MSLQIQTAAALEPRFFNEPAAAYHARAAISQSGLKELAVSPAHFKHRLENPKAPTAPMREGTIAHDFILENATFWQRYAMWKGGSKSSNLYKAFKAEALEAGKELVDEDELEMAKGMREAWLRHPQTKTLLDGAHVEVTALWNDGDTPCKARPDIVRLDTGVIYDLKTTEDASPEAFQRQAYNYHLNQPAWYLDGVERATGVQQKLFVFVVIEKKPPHGIMLYYAERDFLAKGRDRNEAALELYKACVARNEWPAYPQAMQPLSPPYWAKERP